MSGFTIVVPPRLDVVPDITGDPATVETFAEALRDASAAYDDLDTLATDSISPSGWEGEAADAFSAHVRGVAVDAGTTSLALRAIFLAAQDYGDELTRLQSERDRLVTARGTYNMDRQSLVATIESSTEERAAELQGQADDLRVRYDVHVADVTTLVSDESTNEAALRSALSGYGSMSSARSLTLGGDPADALMQRPGAPGTGGTPQQVADWWNGLTEDQRDAVLAAYPDVIGSADGLPSAARDEANRMLLASDLAGLEEIERASTEDGGTMTWDAAQRLENARAAVKGLETAESTIDPETGERLPAFLHLYDPTAFNYDGRIAISVGDPDTAENVTTLVPGMNTTARDAPAYAEAAGNIVQSARISGAGTTAAMFWIGYDHPSDFDVGRVGFEGASREGGEYLAQHVAGLQAARGDNQPHMTVIGHSYGSNTMAHAATDHGLGNMVDDLVFLGSPGAGSAENASDLGSAEVWVGNASRDPVAQLADNGSFNMGTFFGAGLGNDVAEDDFGAIRFQAEDVARAPFATGDTAVDFFTGLPSHTRYWDPGSESLYNVGLIVGGNDTHVVRAEHTYDPWYSGVVDPEWDRTPTYYPDRLEAEEQGEARP